MKETMKCIRCKKELTVNDIVISSSKWAYCKKCREPMLDMTIQPKEHFFVRNYIGANTCRDRLNLHPK